MIVQGIMIDLKRSISHQGVRYLLIGTIVYLTYITMQDLPG